MLAAAWLVPLAWTAAALLAGPSDGTSLTSVLGPSSGTRSAGSVVVARTYGETALLPGDEVLGVDGRTLDDWVDAGGPRREVGDVVSYEVRRVGAGLDRIQQVEVTLGRYPVAAALGPPPTWWRSPGCCSWWARWCSGPGRPPGGARLPGRDGAAARRR